jgi:hypothetical protein
MDGKISWSKLRHNVKDENGDILSESSLSKLIEVLQKKAKLIEKSEERGYCLTEKGKEVGKTISSLRKLTVPPTYEVQVKVAVSSLDRTLQRLTELRELGLNMGSVQEIKQTDLYFVRQEQNKDQNSYIRLRIEQRLDSKERRLIGAPKHVLSLVRNIDPFSFDGVNIIKRDKEDMEVPYPTILFFLEYLFADHSYKRVEKTRFSVDTKLDSVEDASMLKVNLDKLEWHGKSVLGPGAERPCACVEVKTVAWNPEEAKQKCADILKMITKLGLPKSGICDHLYQDYVGFKNGSSDALKNT